MPSKTATDARDTDRGTSLGQNKGVRSFALLIILSLCPPLSLGAPPTSALGQCWQWVWKHAAALRGPTTPPPGTVTSEKAQELFRFFAEDPRLVSEFVEDGCEARSHLFAQLFDHEAFRVEKIFVISGSEDDVVFYGKSKIYPGEDVDWILHVAPLLDVFEDGHVVRKVLDPSLFEGPVPVAVWLKKLAPNLRLPQMKAGKCDGRKAFFSIAPKYVYNALEDNVPLDRWREADTELMNRGLSGLKRELTETKRMLKRGSRRRRWRDRSRH